MHVHQGNSQELLTSDRNSIASSHPHHPFAETGRTRSCMLPKAPKVLDASPTEPPAPIRIAPAARRFLTSRAGHLVSRITGLIRERVIGHYFGVDSVVADAFRAASRIPNYWQTSSAKACSRRLSLRFIRNSGAAGRTKKRIDLAAGVFRILTLICSVLVLSGVLTHPVPDRLDRAGLQRRNAT